MTPRRFCTAAAALMIGAAMLLSSCSTSEPDLPNPVMFVGTYTDGGSQGIYSYRFDPETGGLEPLGLAAEADSPSFLALHPTLPVLYAVNELAEFEGEPSGAVTAYTINYETGKLTKLNQVSTHGAHPCHLVVDRSGQWLIVANYTGGSVAVFPINFTGSLDKSSQLVRHVGSGPDPERQASSHPHSVTVSEDNRFVFVSDLGTDRVYTYRFNLISGELVPGMPAYVSPAPGAGPRHLTYAPDTNSYYGVNELNSTVTSYRLNSESGELTALGSLTTLPDDFAGGNTTAEIVASPLGYVYASNRGDDSIAIYQRDASSGTLTAAGRVPTGGMTPRNFAIDPASRFLYAANQDSSDIVTFAIDSSNGTLTPIGEKLDVPNPVAIVFAEAIATPEPVQ